MIEKFHCVFGPPIALGLSPKFDITLKVIQGFCRIVGVNLGLTFGIMVVLQSIS